MANRKSINAIPLLVALLLTLISVGVRGDTLELANGSLLEGNFVGSSNGVIMFDSGAGIEAFPESEVVGVFFSTGVETAESYLSEAPAS